MIFGSTLDDILLVLWEGRARMSWMPTIIVSAAGVETLESQMGVLCAFLKTWSIHIYFSLYAPVSSVSS